MDTIDMKEIADILKLAGVPCEIGHDSAGRHLYVGSVDLVEGVARFTVVAGPAYGEQVLGPIGEFSFAQDSDGSAPSYAVRRWETPAKVAGRIIELHRRVMQRRHDRSTEDGFDAGLSRIVEAIPGEDIGGPEPTRTKRVSRSEATTTVPRRTCLIAGHVSETFTGLVTQYVGEVLDLTGDLDVTLFTLDDGGDPAKAIAHTGTVVAFRPGNVIEFADGLAVDAGRVISLIH